MRDQFSLDRIIGIMMPKLPDRWIAVAGGTSLFTYLLYCLYTRNNRAEKWFRGKRVLITGGAGGLGVELIQRFNALESKVIIWDVRQEELDRVCKQYNVIGYKVNLADADDVAHVIQQTLEQGGIDVLINNAGMVIGKPLMEADNKLIDTLMRVNTTSHFWTTKGFLPHMLTQKDGHIVTIASTMAMFSASEMVPYCASKAGAFMFGEGLRLELAGTGVETSTIMPWHINTAMFKGLDFPLITRLLAPTLEVSYVADQVIDAIRKRRKMVIMPKIFWFIFLLRLLLPVWLFDLIAHRTGALTAMKGFAGRRINLNTEK